MYYFEFKVLGIKLLFVISYYNNVLRFIMVGTSWIVGSLIVLFVVWFLGHGHSVGKFNILATDFVKVNEIPL